MGARTLETLVTQGLLPQSHAINFVLLLSMVFWQPIKGVSLAGPMVGAIRIDMRMQMKKRSSSELGAGEPLRTPFCGEISSLLTPHKIYEVLPEDVHP